MTGSCQRSAICILDERLDVRDVCTASVHDRVHNQFIRAVDACIHLTTAGAVGNPDLIVRKILVPTHDLFSLRAVLL